MRLTITCTLLAGFMALAQAQQADPLAGKWSGNDIELELKFADSGYTGMLRFRGAQYPVELARDGQGTFSDAQGRYPLSVKQEGEVLVVTSGTATFRLKPVPTRVNPLETPAAGGQADMPPPAGDAKSEEGPAEAEWTTYRHPTGAYIEHPKNWRTQVTQVGLAFLPPDFDQNSELIMAIAAPADQIKSPADPIVGQYFDATVASFAPAMKRVGAPKEMACRAGKGALYEYSGTLATGQAAKARFYTTILGPQAVAIVIIATEQKMQQRAAVLDRMFGTIGQGEAKRDSALVGNWKSMTTNSDMGGTGNVFQSTDSVFSLSPDGKVVARVKAYSSVSAKGADGMDVGGAASESEKTYTGTWSADGGPLFVLWQDGTTSSGTYQIHSNGMTFTPDGGKAIAMERI